MIKHIIADSVLRIIVNKIILNYSLLYNVFNITIVLLLMLLMMRQSSVIQIRYVSNFPYLVLLILEFVAARLATLPHGLDSNVTQLLANLLTKPSVF